MGRTGTDCYGAAAGTRALVSFGRSDEPSLCWQVRMKTTVPTGGTP